MFVEIEDVYPMISLRREKCEPLLTDVIVSASLTNSERMSLARQLRLTGLNFQIRVDLRAYGVGEISALERTCKGLSQHQIRGRHVT